MLAALLTYSNFISTFLSLRLPFVLHLLYEPLEADGTESPFEKIIRKELQKSAILSSSKHASPGLAA